MKKFYAMFNQYGVGFGFGPDVEGWRLHAFSSQEALDRWLEKHSIDEESGNVVAREITPRQIISALGRRFYNDPAGFTWHND